MDWYNWRQFLISCFDLIFYIFPKFPTIRDHSLSTMGCCCLVAKARPALLWPRGLLPARFLCPWAFPGKNTGAGCHFQPRDRTCIFCLVGGFFTTETLGKPSNMGNGGDFFFLILKERKRIQSFLSLGLPDSGFKTLFYNLLYGSFT